MAAVFEAVRPPSSSGIAGSKLYRLTLRESEKLTLQRSSSTSDNAFCNACSILDLHVVYSPTLACSFCQVAILSYFVVLYICKTMSRVLFKLEGLNFNQLYFKVCWTEWLSSYFCFQYSWKIMYTSLIWQFYKIANYSFSVFCMVHV